jgi:hypothetical protein
VLEAAKDTGDEPSYEAKHLTRNSANQVSAEFEPSLWIRDLEIEILRAETRVQKRDHCEIPEN